jgi:hypothetical protein
MLMMCGLRQVLHGSSTFINFIGIILSPDIDIQICNGNIHIRYFLISDYQFEEWKIQ